ncbi:MAG TPA: Gfo/Idh/MocA family oxidoreductase, partial [Balneolales bacterium]|nr:Gfo/Idh/MocA family oxidoreductase [Balneolales bacterium]
MNNFRFVIVGSGNISNTYCNAIDKLEAIDIVGVVSRSGNKPKALEPRDDVEVAPTISQITKDFDAVILCTPNGYHHKGAIEAADLGKHVLTEKVLDISMDAMDTIINSCKENGVRLGVAYQRRMSPDNQIIK